VGGRVITGKRVCFVGHVLLLFVYYFSRAQNGRSGNDHTIFSSYAHVTRFEVFPRKLFHGCCFVQLLCAISPQYSLSEAFLNGYRFFLRQQTFAHWRFSKPQTLFSAQDASFRTNAMIVFTTIVTRSQRRKTKTRASPCRVPGQTPVKQF